MHQLPLAGVPEALARIACVHVGTPKTGTTAIQAFLAVNRERLLEAGIVYPRAGCPTAGPTFAPGHHLVPRELATGEASPSLDAVIAEAKSSGAPSLIISSEEFHALVPHPAFGAVVAGLKSLDYVPVALVFLRGQALYAESIYIEMLKGGFLTLFDWFAAEILRTGEYVQKASGQHIEFVYSRMIAQLESHFGAGLVVPRPYNSGLAAKKLPLEVLEIVGRLRGDLHVKGLMQPSHENTSLSLRAVLRILRRFSRVPPDMPDLPDAELDARFSLLTYEDVVRFYERFAEDNRDVNERFGIEIPFAKISDVPAADHPRFARARIQREAIGRIIERIVLA